MKTIDPRAARLWIGIGLFTAGFWLGIARALGALGNPLHADGAMLVVLILLGVGIYLMVTVKRAEDRDFERNRREANR